MFVVIVFVAVVIIGVGLIHARVSSGGEASGFITRNVKGIAVLAG